MEESNIVEYVDKIYDENIKFSIKECPDLDMYINMGAEEVRLLKVDECTTISFYFLQALSYYTERLSKINSILEILTHNHRKIVGPESKNYKCSWENIDSLIEKENEAAAQLKRSILKYKIIKNSIEGNIKIIDGFAKKFDQIKWGIK
jgi:hypothetical protein